MLPDLIIQRIKKEGPISFCDFMEMALYYPNLGYYTSVKETIGEKGDYYTSSTLTKVFGAMIARQLEEMDQIISESSFAIVEYGAGTGALCHDILDALRPNQQLYEKLTYFIIEKSDAMKQTQAKHLRDKVKWIDSINEISGFNGCILSNELLDNFAVHQVVMEDELMEVYVGYENSFVELLRPAGQPLKDYFRELGVILSKGFRTEINLQAIQWINDIAKSLNKGFILTIDYGYLSMDLYSDRRRNGTLICYNKHTTNEQPYIDIGKQDITSHVNFSALCYWGEKSGLDFSGFTDQAYFLISLGFKEYMRKKTIEGKDFTIKDEIFLTRTLLMDMGNKFKVLIQAKNLPGNKLSGLALSNFSAC